MNTVKLSDKHLEVICRALETYYRLKSGQIKIALDTAYEYVLTWNEAIEIESHIRKLLPQFEELHPNAAYSFNSSQIGDGKIAYEIEKVFSEYLSVKKNDGYYGFSTNFNGPLKASDEPFPIILDHKNYKDFPLDRKQSQIIVDYHKKQNYTEIWEYIDSLNLNLPKGEKSEIIFDRFIGEEALYGGSNTRAVIRVYKPRKE